MKRICLLLLALRGASATDATTSPFTITESPQGLGMDGSICNLIDPTQSGINRCVEVMTTIITQDFSCTVTAQETVFVSSEFLYLNMADQLVLFPGDMAKEQIIDSMNQYSGITQVQFDPGETFEYRFFAAQDTMQYGTGTLEVCGYAQPGTCDNSCTCRPEMTMPPWNCYDGGKAHNGECDDGEEGSVTSFCEPGTDCDDCTGGEPRYVSPPIPPISPPIQPPIPAIPPLPPLPSSEFAMDSPALRVFFNVMSFNNPSSASDITALYEDGGFFARAVASFVGCNVSITCDVIMPAADFLPLPRAISTTIGPVLIVWKDVNSTSECTAPPPFPPPPPRFPPPLFPPNMAPKPPPEPRPPPTDATGGRRLEDEPAPTPMPLREEPRDRRQMYHYGTPHNSYQYGGTDSYSTDPYASSMPYPSDDGTMYSDAPPSASGGSSETQTQLLNLLTQIMARLDGPSTGVPGSSAFPTYPTYPTYTPSTPRSRVTGLRCANDYFVPQSAFDARDAAREQLLNLTLINTTASEAFVTTLRTGLNGTVVYLSAPPTIVEQSYPRTYAKSPSPPPRPEQPPPPSPPPAPPSYPPGLCSNECNAPFGLGSAGVCDDGGPGSTTDLCPLGTDCRDCRKKDRETDLGDRSYCTSCAAACRDQNAALVARGVLSPTELCLEEQLGNGVCDFGCNNRACNYDSTVSAGGDVVYDCTPTTMRETCLTEQEMSPVDLATPPQDPVPMAVHFSMGAGRLSINGDINQMIWLQEIEYTLQWSDPRLFNSSCAGSLAARSKSQPSMVSITRLQSRSDIDRSAIQKRRGWYWFPAVNFPDLRPDFDAWDDYVNFTMENVRMPTEGAPVTPTREWLVPEVKPAGVDTPQCEHCVEWVGGIEFELLEEFEYTYYPFDSHTVKVSFEILDTDLYTCSEQYGMYGEDGKPFSDDDAEGMIIGGNEWNLAGSSKSWKSAISLAKAEDRFGNPIDSVCELTVKIRRIPTAYLVKGVFSTVLVVGGSLVCALLLHPEEFIGDRAAVLFIAFLILVTNMQTDLGLGVISSVLWVDYFNLVQLLLLLLLIIETMLVHALFRSTDRVLQEVGMHVDHVAKRMFALAYTVITTLLILWGWSEGAWLYGIIIIMVLFLLAVIIVSYLWIRFLVTALQRRQEAAVVALASVDGSDAAAFDEAVKEVFFAFDQDASGALGLDEFRELTTMLHPGATKDVVRKAMLQVRSYCNAKDELDLESFTDSLSAIDAFMKENLSAEAYNKGADTTELSAMLKANKGKAKQPKKAAAAAPGLVKNLSDPIKHAFGFPKPAASPLPAVAEQAGATSHLSYPTAVPEAGATSASPTVIPSVNVQIDDAPQERPSSIVLPEPSAVPPPPLGQAQLPADFGNVSNSGGATPTAEPAPVYTAV